METSISLHSILDGAKGIIFDKDGTLLDHDGSWAEQTRQFGLMAAGGNLGIAKRLLKEQLYDWDKNQFEGGDGVAGNTWEVTAARMRESMAARGEDCRHIDKALDWILKFEGQPIALPDVSLVLQAVKAAGLRIGLATNDAEANGVAHMKAIDADQFFDTVVGSDSGYGGKPNPSMIEGCAARMGLLPTQCVMIGDTDRDTIAGKAANCRAVVAALNGAARSVSITKSADLVLDHTRDLLLRLTPFQPPNSTPTTAKG